jgi:hypothetical protein
MTSLPVTSLPVTSLSVMSHPVAMLLSLMSSGTFCTTTIVRKKRRDALPGMRRTCFRLSRHFRSRDFMWRHFRSGPFPMTSIPVAHAQWPAPLCFPRNMPWAIPIYYFDIWIWGALYISHEKLTKDGKVLCHLRFMSKVLLGTLTDINA